MERNRDKSLGVTVYLGHRRGNASTSDFSEAAIERPCRRPTILPASPPKTRCRPARTPTTSHLPPSTVTWTLFHPWQITSEEAARLALECEAAAFATHKRITNSEGAGVSAQQSHFFSATRGFFRGLCDSRHSMSVAPIASLPGKHGEMQRDAWYSSQRSASELAARPLPWALRRPARPEPPGQSQDPHHRMPGAVRIAPGRGPAGRLRAGHERRRAVPQEQLPGRSAGQAGVSKHIDILKTRCPARQGQLAV